MGEFFREEERKVEIKEEKLITEPQELFMAYNILINKIQLTINEGGEAIMPIKIELLGGKRTPNDTGQVGELRKRIEGSRIARMDIGIMMWAILKNIEDLDNWANRYEKFLEGYLDAMEHIAKSSFKIISNLHANINNLHKTIEELQSRAGRIRELPKMEIPAKKMPEAKKGISPAIKAEPVKKSVSSEVEDIPNEDDSSDEIEIPPTPAFVELPVIPSTDSDGPPQIDIFQRLIDKKIEEYREARKTGDEDKIEAGRRQLYALCGRDRDLRRRVKDLIIRLDMEN